MEPNVVAIVILVVLVGGTVAVLSWQRPDLTSLPGLRGLSMVGAGRAEEPRRPEPELGLTAEMTAEAAALLPRSAIKDSDMQGFSGRNGGDNLLALDPARLDPAPVPVLSPLLSERLDRLESQLTAMQNALAQQQARIVQLAAEMHRRADAGEQRQDLILERIRADLNATANRLAAERQPGRERRLDVSAELYARLARLEAALAAVTNPVLLPGEPYEAPGELVTEALIWENWNEVGELVFALADAYSAQRVHLSEQARIDIGGFVTSLRVLLTKSIYPNLHTDLDAAHQAELQGYLAQTAVELGNLRLALDKEYQTALGPPA